MRSVYAQQLRAIAAALVIVDHAIGSLQWYGLFPASRHDNWVMGDIGVQAFFVLSGALMVRQTDRIASGVTACAGFLWKRFARIVPLYWIATLLSYAIDSPPHSLSDLLCSLFFIPYFAPSEGMMRPIVGSGWTLNLEIVFYVLFGLSLLFRRSLSLMCVVAVLWLATYSHAMTPDAAGEPHTISGFFTADIVNDFRYGVIAGLIVVASQQRVYFKTKVSPAVFLLTPAVLILVAGFIKPSYLDILADNFHNNLGYFCFIIVCACFFCSPRKQTKLGTGLEFLGNASFCTYLFHQHAINWVLGVWTLHPRLAGTSWMFVAESIVASYVLGVVLHIGVEQPIGHLLQRFRLSMQKRLHRQTPVRSATANVA